MKKTIVAIAMALTMAATAFTGIAAPVSAMSLDQTGTYHNGQFYYDADLANSTNDAAQANHTGTRKGTARVTGTKHYLAFRSQPADNSRNVIGPLYNGNEVQLLGSRKGNYVKVYSPDYGCNGWVNANYLR